MRIQSSYHALSSKIWHTYRILTCRYRDEATPPPPPRPFFSVLQNRLKILTPLYICKKTPFCVPFIYIYIFFIKARDGRCTMHVNHGLTSQYVTLCFATLNISETDTSRELCTSLTKVSFLSAEKKTLCIWWNWGGEKQVKKRLPQQLLEHKARFIFNTRREGLLWLMWCMDVFK